MRVFRFFFAAVQPPLDAQDAVTVHGIGTVEK